MGCISLPYLRPPDSLDNTAGRIMRSCPLPSSAMMRPRSWRRSRRPGRGRPRPISAAHSPTRRALRVARFGTANEHADWETALHVFTYANAIHQAFCCAIRTN